MGPARLTESASARDRLDHRHEADHPRREVLPHVAGDGFVCDEQTHVYGARRDIDTDAIDGKPAQRALRSGPDLRGGRAQLLFGVLSSRNTEIPLVKPVQLLSSLVAPRVTVTTGTLPSTNQKPPKVAGC